MRTALSDVGQSNRTDFVTMRCGSRGYCEDCLLDAS